MSRVAALNMIAESFCPVRWISVVLWCSVLATHHVWPISRTSAQLVPATFCFGDSLADPGNNNYINTLSKANYPFNGIDFAAGPTGRFTNGRTTVDIIGELLGFKDYLPPYMAPSTTGNVIRYGVNYASGAAGILDSSGYAFIGRIPLSQQLEQFAKTSAQITQLLGPEAGSNLIAQSIYSVNLGANDFLDNYYAPFSPIGNLSAGAVNNLLLSTYQQHLTKLYSMGARKIVVASVGPAGCTPYRLTTTLAVNGECDQKVNQQIQAFNTGLEALLDGLNANLPGVQFIYLNAYDAVYEIIQNPNAYGFTISDTACCGTGGTYKGLLPCTPLSSLCSDRTNYVFWDPYHTSDKANVILSNRFFYGDSSYARPMNIQQLALLNL
jgi:phospholipase/lecithinase/hemolysin